MTTVVLAAHEDDVISIQRDVGNGSQGEVQGVSSNDKKQNANNNGDKRSIDWVAISIASFCLIVPAGFTWICFNWDNFFTSEGRAKRRRHNSARKIIEGEAYIKLREMRGCPDAAYEDLLPKSEDRKAFQFIINKISYCSSPLDIFKEIVSSSDYNFGDMVKNLTKEEIERFAGFINTMAANLDEKAVKAEKVRSSEEREKQGRHERLVRIIEGDVYTKLRREIRGYSYEDLLPTWPDRTAFQNIIEKINFSFYSDPLKIFQNIKSSYGDEFNKMVGKFGPNDIEKFANFINKMAANLDKKTQQKAEAEVQRKALNEQSIKGISPTINTPLFPQHVQQPVQVTFLPKENSGSMVNLPIKHTNDNTGYAAPGSQNTPVVSLMKENDRNSKENSKNDTDDVEPGSCLTPPSVSCHLCKQNYKDEHTVVCICNDNGHHVCKDCFDKGIKKCPVCDKEINHEQVSLIIFDEKNSELVQKEGASVDG